MPYSINIYDRKDLGAQTNFEHGQKSSFNLKWHGSSDKLNFIHGSGFDFNMEVTDFQDGYFSHLNSSDERRFWVVIINEETGGVHWEGHILPDLYEEPYKVGAFFVKFTASCGLGGLKGQYLPNSFYSLENSRISILSEILKLTGLELDINVSPAMVNPSYPKWEQNYISGTDFWASDKKMDAYSVLERMMKSALCRITQRKGEWFITGLNKAVKFSLQYERYDHLGANIGGSTVERSPLDMSKNKFEADPVIRTHTPVKTISFVHDLDESVIDESVYKVKNDGFVLSSDTVLVNREWVYNSVSFTPKYNTKDGKTFLSPLGNISNWVKLRKEVLLAEGDKVDWSMEAHNYWDGSGDQGRTVEEIVLEGDWETLLPYEIFYTNPSTGTETVVFSNWTGPDKDDLRYQLSFGTDRRAELSIPMIAPVTAYYNVRFYQPQGSTGIKTTGITITKLECIPINAESFQEYSNTITDTYTKSIEDDLHHHDDMRQLSGLLRMSPLAEQGGTYGTITLNNLEVLSNADGEYIKLTLESLKAALAHSDAIQVDGKRLLVLGKIYNYLGSQEMYLQYDPVDYGGTVQAGSSMVITLREFAPIPSDIAQWQQWTDDFYGVGQGRYGDTFIEVVRRLYTKPHPLLFGTCQGLVDPGDLVLFNYKGEKIWYVLDCQQHLDRYSTTVVLSQNFYGQAVTDNLPPVVDAGADQSLLGAQTTSVLHAVASDPEGNIASVLWELIGPVGSTATIADPDQLQTNITDLVGDDFIFQVTVTDDVGLTDVDTVRLQRPKNYQLVLDKIRDYELSTTPENQDKWQAVDSEWFDISVSPDLDDDQVARITIDGIIVLETPNNIAGARPSAVFKMGYDYQFFEAGAHQMIVLLRKGETKTLALQAKAYNSAQYGIFPDYAGKVRARLQVDMTAEIAQGTPGEFTNVPIQLNYEAIK